MNVTINYTIEEIVKYTNGRLVNHNPGLPSPTYLSLDSRKILFPESTIFVALNTPHRDSNEFVEILYKKGIRNFLIEGDNIDLPGSWGQDPNPIVAGFSIHRFLRSLRCSHRQDPDPCRGAANLNRVKSVC